MTSSEIIITKAGIEDMLNQVTRHADYGSNGHDYGDNRDVEFVHACMEFMKTMPADRVVIPGWMVAKNLGVLTDIVCGYGRPLSYLCSDCRYPKWKLSDSECIAEYGQSFFENTIKAKYAGTGGFTEWTRECPKCGD